MEASQYLRSQADARVFKFNQNYSIYQYSTSTYLKQSTIFGWMGRLLLKAEDSATSVLLKGNKSVPTQPLSRWKYYILLSNIYTALKYQAECKKETLILWV